MHISHILLQLDKIRAISLLQYFTVYLRYLIGGAFVIAAFGMGKIHGNVNLMSAMDKPIGELMPIQQFFRVMMESGLYWHFIGWSQIVAGTLMMTQKFARMGTLIFFGIILNIFLITVAYGFTGTPIVTGLMLMAAFYLLVWDARYLLPILLPNIEQRTIALHIADHSYWRWLGIMMVISCVIVGYLRVGATIESVLICLVEGLIGWIVFLFFIRRRIA